MFRFIIMRIGGLIGVLLAVSLLTFFLMHLVPGGPFDAMTVADGTDDSQGNRRKSGKVIWSGQTPVDAVLAFLESGSSRGFWLLLLRIRTFGE